MGLSHDTHVAGLHPYIMGIHSQVPARNRSHGNPWDPRADNNGIPNRDPVWLWLGIWATVLDDVGEKANLLWDLEGDLENLSGTGGKSRGELERGPACVSGSRAWDVVEKLAGTPACGKTRSQRSWDNA